MIQEAQNALEALEVFANNPLLTPDENEALWVVKNGLEAIARGEVLEPWREGQPLTKRMLIRINIHYVHPSAPRPVVDKPKEPEPAP